VSLLKTGMATCQLDVAQTHMSRLAGKRNLEPSAAP